MNKLLGVKIDFKLNLDSHAHDTFKPKTLNPISRITLFMDLNKNVFLVKSFSPPI